MDPSGEFPFPVGYEPGDDLSKHFVLAKPSKEEGDPLFWRNGVARKHHAQFNEFVQSRHATHNSMRCFDCHEVHRPKRPRRVKKSPLLLAKTQRYHLRARAHNASLKCHLQRESNYRIVEGKVIDSHTQHPPIIPKEGTRRLEKMFCWECHMPQIDRGSVYRTSAHLFRVPGPENTLAFGVPNACNRCHTDHDAEWAKRRIESWRTERPPR